MCKHPLVAESRVYSLSRCVGSPLRWFLLLWSKGSAVAADRLRCLAACGNLLNPLAGQGSPRVITFILEIILTVSTSSFIFVNLLKSGFVHHCKVCQIPPSCEIPWSTPSLHLIWITRSTWQRRSSSLKYFLPLVSKIPYSSFSFSLMAALSLVSFNKFSSWLLNVGI